MKILVSGSTGLVGTALIPALTGLGHEVARLVRTKARNPSKEMVGWNPEQGEIDSAGLEGIDAVVHLAGEPIAAGRWNAVRKQRIHDSRVVGTRTLCEAIAKLQQPPQTLLCASAIGYYGDRTDETLTETSSSGNDFLAEVCREWERACDAARNRGVRVVSLRFGVILSRHGGALAKMLFPFKMGIGGVLGSGRQYMSCISIDDCVGAIVHSLNTASLAGPVNIVGITPVTNSEFTKALGRVLGRPTILPMPAFAARAAFGEMADALLLSSTRVVPQKLLESGYSFRHANLEAALQAAINS